MPAVSSSGTLKVLLDRLGRQRGGKDVVHLHDHWALSGKLMIERHFAEARQRRLVAQLGEGRAPQKAALVNRLGALLVRLGERAATIIQRPFHLEGTPADR